MAGRRIRIRRLRAAGVLAGVAALAVLTGTRLLASSSSTAATTRAAEAIPRTVWPAYGQSAFAEGGGPVHAGPGQHQAAIASVAKVMTAYVVLGDHPLRLGEDGPTLSLTDDDVADAEYRRAREESVREREQTLRRRLESRLDDQLREARREIDAVIEKLKARATVLREKGEKRAAGPLSTGETGMARSEAHAALDIVGSRVKSGTALPEQTIAAPAAAEPLPALAPGVRVSGPLGVEGVVLEIVGKHAEIDVRGKRMRARVADLRVIGKAPAARASVSIDLQPRQGSLSELNVVGCTVDEALTRAARFLDETMLTDRREVRIIHGHGTGQLRRALTAFFKEHPLVSSVELARTEHGGMSATGRSILR